MAGISDWRKKVDEKQRTLKLWIRRKHTNKRSYVPAAGQPVDNIHEICQREVRDLPVVQFRTTVVIEMYRVGVRIVGRRSNARGASFRAKRLSANKSYTQVTLHYRENHLEVVAESSDSM